jgi:hypothetical protein
MLLVTLGRYFIRRSWLGKLGSGLNGIESKQGDGFTAIVLVDSSGFDCSIVETHAQTVILRPAV